MAAHEWAMWHPVVGSSVCVKVIRVHGGRTCDLPKPYASLHYQHAMHLVLTITCFKLYLSLYKVLFWGKKGSRDSPQPLGLYIIHATKAIACVGANEPHNHILNNQRI